MEKVWDFLNGKKMAIGFLILWLTDKPWFLQLVPDGPIESAIFDILVLIGSTLAGTGILHKGYKWYEENKANKNNG
mgnify:CR=1 FL=1